MTVKYKISIQRILAIVLFCLLSTGALIYARIWNPDFIPFLSDDMDKEEATIWQEDAWKEYQELSKKYRSPISISGTISIVDSSEQPLNQTATPFQFVFDNQSTLYELGEWHMVQQDSILLLIDHNEKNIILQVLPNEMKQPVSSQIIPNILGLSKSLVQGVTSKLEKNGLKSINLILRNSEVEKIQLLYNPATGYLTEATIWQNELMALTDHFETEDSTNLNGIREFEWDYGQSSDSIGGSIKAFFAQRISKLTYQIPTSVDKAFRPVNKYMYLKDGSWEPTEAFKNYQIAIK